MLLVLIPLYLLVLTGVFLHRGLNLRKEPFAVLLIYFLAPLVIFNAVLKAKLDFEHMLLPLLFWGGASLVCFLSYGLASIRFASPVRNILAFASGNLNSGYFGIPVGLALFGDGALSSIVLCSFGITLYENTIGFYVSARGRHSRLESLQKAVRLPAVYAFVAGLMANLAALQMNAAFQDLFVNIRGAYSVLGMMLIGLAVAEQKTSRPDLGFAFFACLMKFAVWPLFFAALLYLDGVLFGIFSPEVARIVFFMSTLPIAANTVPIAAILKTEPERAAFAVILSTLLALLMVPLLNGWYR